MTADPLQSPTLGDVMAADPEHVEPSTTIRKAAEIMRDHDVGALPVIDDGQLVGIVTDRDIVINAVSRGLDPDDNVVGPIVSTAVIAGTPEMTLRDAAELMSLHQVRRLPVVQNGRLVGMVSMQDLAQAAGPATVGATEQNITAPPGGPNDEIAP